MKTGNPISAAPGIAAALALSALLAGTLAAVAWRTEGGQALAQADWAAIRFTLVQALLSALLSVVLAVPVARALARRRFPGRALLVTLLGAPFLLPVIVAVMGLLAVFGRAGWVNALLAWAGLPQVGIYGLHGVVLAHVFFNLPLATRLLLQGWNDVPGEQIRLAAMLGANRRAAFRLIEAPMLRRILPGAFAVIFAICLSSFAVALTLGGGPRATTIELAIYQAFRFDFDLGRAALLACAQIGLTLSAGLLALRFASDPHRAGGHDRAPGQWLPGSSRLLDAAVITLAALFLLLPLAAVALRGAAGLAQMPPEVARAALLSVGLALASTAMALGLALPMALAAGLGHRALAGMAGLLGLAVSPLVIGTGLFILLRPFTNPVVLALPVTALTNAIMALPFLMAILHPRAAQIIADHGRLGQQLNMHGIPFLRLVVLPRMTPQIGFAAGLAAALSMGDLGVIALFAAPDQATLPLQVFRLMGAYRTDAASGAALLLLALSLALFWLFDGMGRRHAAA